MSRTGKSTKMESKFVVTQGWRKEDEGISNDRYRISFVMMKIL